MDWSLLLVVAAAIVRGLWLLVGFLTHTGAFPHPLGEAEEARCLADLRKGDMVARDRLIEHNLRLVAHIVKKFDNTGEDTDDLISIGAVGLIKAIDTFKPEKGARLATYAARCIENEILMHLRALKRNRGEMFLFDPIGVDRDGNEVTLIDVLDAGPDEVPDIVSRRFEEAELREKIALLPEKERQVLEMRYGLGGRRRQTQREIARQLGISRSYVSRIEKKAVGRLVQAMRGNEARMQPGPGQEADD